MAKEKKDIINPGSITGTAKGVVNINSRDYKGLQKAIIEDAGSRTPRQKITYRLLSLKYQMESYIRKEDPNKIIEAGEFLRKHLEAIGITQKEFAQYLDIEESNLSAILSSRRKINIDLAFKLGRLFDLDPNSWLLIQSKNELLKMEEEKKKSYGKYNLEDLLRKSG